MSFCETEAMDRSSAELPSMRVHRFTSRTKVIRYHGVGKPRRMHSVAGMEQLGINAQHTLSFESATAA